MQAGSTSVQFKKPRRSWFWRLVGLGFLGFIAWWGANLFLPNGWLERAESAWSGQVQLPSCNSKITEGEIVTQFGSFVRFVNATIPFAGMSIRRSKELAFDARHGTRRCEGEVTTILGSGSIEYQVEWYDPRSPSLDAIRVSLLGGNLPTVLQKLRH
ncbi:hypothetical protein [Andreprevotia chitinilytica]|uniref:hypothetical protein n=1 Tax=Andreprevotia chitinilytica TaxID=396808 RepID=UPI000554F548|nr:hypothetical protein [Andreprevotia chitinilytica]